jgi:hypothetical protein
MQTVKIKPLSVNQAWKGKRYKTDEYKRFERKMLMLLPKLEVPSGKLRLIIILGLSNKNADWDNPIKPLQDILQKKYGFNDKMVYLGIVYKVDVKKGEEFIKFDLSSYEYEF